MTELREIAEIAVPENYAKPLITIELIIIVVLVFLLIIMSIWNKFKDWIQQQ